MIRGTRLMSVSLFVVLLGTSAPAKTLTIVESEPGGKRVLFVDPDQDLSYQEVQNSSNGKTLFYIDKENILTPKKESALVVDDKDIRRTPTGVVIATFDGEDIVHGRHGKVIMNYHHPDICPKSQANRIYTVTGPQLSKQQLVAVLYALKPELFTLTAEEEAAQKKEMSANAAEADRLATLDQLAGKWDILNGHGAVENISKGSITFTPTKNGAYPVTFDHKADGGPEWTGVAVYKDANGDKLVWVAYGTPKSIGLCVYEIDGGKLTGKWFPWYINGEAKNTGTEHLTGPQTLDGDFKIDSATAPSTGAAYTGTVTIKPIEIVGAGDDEKPYSLTWTMGSTKVEGIGIRTGKFLYVASGTGADVNIAKFKIQNGSFSGDWFKLGSNEMGGTAAMTAIPN